MGSNLDRLLRLADPAADHDLLGQLPGGAGDAAFAELVRRHGPTVLGVCRRVLGHEQDAEDAFQATFLVLARRAGSVRRAESLSAWLFGVARHVALRLRDKDHRRRRHEQAAGRPEATTENRDGDEWLTVLDEEVGRLPERYRTPVVSCHLAGRTQEDAARELGWSLSTLRRRLDRGRELLRTRLTGRGLTLPAGVLALSGVAVPGALAEATRRAVVEFVNGDRGSAPAVLAEGVLAMMARAKLIKGAAGVLLVLGGVAAVWQTAPGNQAPPADPAAVRPDDPKPKADPRVGPNAPAGAPDDRIRPGDRLTIKATNTFEAHPIDGVFVVEAGGTVAIGPTYGRARVEGLTLMEAETRVLEHLKKYLRDPGVQLTRAAGPDEDRVGKLEKRVQQLEQEILELRGVIRQLQVQKVPPK